MPKEFYPQLNIDLQELIEEFEHNPSPSHRDIEAKTSSSGGPCSPIDSESFAGRD
jgi:hypothetical protein